MSSNEQDNSLSAKKMIEKMIEGKSEKNKIRKIAIG